VILSRNPRISQQFFLTSLALGGILGTATGHVTSAGLFLQKPTDEFRLGASKTVVPLSSDHFVWGLLVDFCWKKRGMTEINFPGITSDIYFTSHFKGIPS